MATDSRAKVFYLYSLSVLRVTSLHFLLLSKCGRTQRSTKYTNRSHELTRMSSLIRSESYRPGDFHSHRIVADGGGSDCLLLAGSTRDANRSTDRIARGVGFIVWAGPVLSCDSGCTRSFFSRSVSALHIALRVLQVTSSYRHQSQTARRI